MRRHQNASGLFAMSRRVLSTILESGVNGFPSSDSERSEFGYGPKWWPCSCAECAFKADSRNRDHLKSTSSFKLIFSPLARRLITSSRC